VLPPVTTEVNDRGTVASVELMLVLAAVLAGVATIGALGRLHAAGVEVGAVAQAAARAASLAPDSTSARTTAIAVVSRSALVRRCVDPPATTMRWSASPLGTWQGGSVTVAVSCRIDGVGPSRSITMSDTQPIDRFQR
jgi:hypothetical protein